MIPRLQRGAVLSGITALVTLAQVVSASAQASYSIFPAKQTASNIIAVQPTNRMVTIVVRDSTLEYVINELARQAHLQPQYVDNPALAKRISVRIIGIDISNALTTVLQGTGLRAQIAADGVTLVVRTGSGLASPGRVRIAGGVVVGRVTDSASGQGLPGAAVRVAGIKGLLTVTSDSGKFTLRDVPAGDQVVMVRLFGFKPADRAVTVVDSQRTVVRIVMVAVPTVLSGVVTTATGLQQRIQVGSDITVLNADSVMKIAPVTNVTDLLETRVPGLVVQHTSGIPGAPSRIRIRGIGSINSSNDPIVIVDGIRIYSDQSGSTNALTGTQSGGGTSVTGTSVPTGNNSSGTHTTFAGPSPIDQIDPNSIETIEILKGPSATALYGSDAGAGVIVITTKHGRAGPTQWSFNLNQGRTTFPGQWPINYYVFGHNEFGANGASVVGCTAPSCVQDSVVGFQALNDPRYSPLTGQAGQNRGASLTVSGGSGPFTYSITGSGSGQSGYLHLPPIEQQRFETYHDIPVPGWMKTPDQYTTYGGTSTITALLNKEGTTVALTNSIYHSAGQQSSLQNDLAALSQMYVDTTTLAEQPLFPDYYTRAQLTTTTFNNAVSLSNWKPWSWLPINATLGLNVGDFAGNTVLPNGYVTCQFNTTDPHCQADSAGRYTLSQGTNTDGSLHVGTNLWSRGWVSTALGIDVNTVAQSSISLTQDSLIPGINIPAIFYNPSNYNTWNSSTYGWYVQPQFNLNSRFFVSPGFRFDGGSNSGAHGGVNGDALSLLPKINVSYVALNRTASNPCLGMTLLRPRLSFGVSGVQPAPDEQYRLLNPFNAFSGTTYNSERVNSNTSVTQSTLGLYSIGNTQLHPERDQELEGGVDITFGNQRLTLTLTGYNKLAKDAILQVPLPPSLALLYSNKINGSGYIFGQNEVLNSYLGNGTQAVNIGDIRNRGFEGTFDVRVVDSRLVAWTVNGNLSKNSNELLRLAPGVSSLDFAGTGSDAIPTRFVPGYPVYGLWARPVIGFSDVNGNGVIDPGEIRVADSAIYVGQPEPNYEFSLGTVISLFNNRLTIATAIDYQNGLTQVMDYSNIRNQYLNPANTAEEQALLVSGYFGGCTGGYTLPTCSAIGSLQTVNALRWQNLSIAYLVPPSTARKLFRVPRLSIALQGSNLGLYTKYRGADPNVNANFTGNLTSDNGNELPQPRLWSLSLTLGN